MAGAPAVAATLDAAAAGVCSFPLAVSSAGGPSLAASAADAATGKMTAVEAAGTVIVAFCCPQSTRGSGLTRTGTPGAHILDAGRREGCKSARASLKCRNAARGEAE